MKCLICGSHAINEHLYQREIGVDSNLCDVHYWQKRAVESSIQLTALNSFETKVIAASDEMSKNLG